MEMNELDPHFLFPPPEDKNKTEEEPCANVNCGEAGCLWDAAQGRTRCVCVPSFMPPNEEGLCLFNITQVQRSLFNISHLEPVTMPPFPSGATIKPNTTNLKSNPKNESAPLRFSSTPRAGGSAPPALHVALAVLGAALLLLAAAVAVVLLVRRKRRARLRAVKLESPVAWLHRQDSATLLDHMTVLSKNPNYLSSELEVGLRTRVIPRDKLSLRKEVGEGAFGKVYRGSVLEDEGERLVAVKVLKEGVSREARDDFTREVRIMSGFDHENILKLIGVVTIDDDAPYMVFEYMEHGDLADVLRSNDPAMGRTHVVQLREADLIDTALQIARGMMYLSSKHFVHRDLATRNCLVGGELCVKISDFGMSRDIYTCDYYKIGGSRMLPVRWMSPESVKYGRFTAESDVWAYGVVLWEIFSLGKQPYYGHANEEVIRFIEDGILLQKPDSCPDTVYHVMLGCWRTDPKERFCFERIHRHLHEYNQNHMKSYHQPSPMQTAVTIEI